MSPRRRRGRKRGRGGGLPSSMLDLIWILLFFFLMISTIKRREELEALVDRVPLLGASAARDSRASRSAVLHIEADGRMLLDGVALAPEGLRAAIARIRGEDRDERRLILDVDRDARVEDLLRAEDVAREVGMECVVRRRVEAADESGA